MQLEKLFKAVRNAYGRAQKYGVPGGRAFYPFSVILVITARCNLNCRFCFLVVNEALQKRRNDELSKEEWKSVIRQTPPWAIVTFTGGEPFIRRDFGELLEYTANRRIVHLITNGILLSEDNCEHLVRLAPSRLGQKGVLVVGLSLMGGAEVHDDIVRVQRAYERTLSGLGRLQALKRRTGKRWPLIDLKVVLSKANYNHLEGLLPLLKIARPDYVTLQLETSIDYPWYKIEPGKMLEGPLDMERILSFPPKVDGPEPAQLLEALDNFVAQVESVNKDDKVNVKLRYYPESPLSDYVTHLHRNSDLERGFCVSPWTDCFVGPFGDVGICLGGTVGNVRNQPLMSLFNAPKFREFRQLLGKSNIFKGCRGCCFYQSE